MPKTVTDIYQLFYTRLPGWSLQEIPPLSEAEKEASGTAAFTPQQVSLLVSPQGEQIVAIFSETSVTGTERAKPQIRLFTDRLIAAYKYAKWKKLRFFAFVICKTDPATLKFSAGIYPDDYLVSLESSFDRCPSGRIDIRSMYEALAENQGKAYFRLSAGQHACASVAQASFIRISREGQPIGSEVLQAYLTYFDNRPYVLSSREGKQVVYEPSALFEKAAAADSRYPWNMLVFGAPGTGKSHLLAKKVKELAEKNKEGQVKASRVTFYADYTYQQFVGGYMPVPRGDIQEQLEVTDGTRVFSGNMTGPRITYEFVPGPFGSLLAKSLAAKLSGRPDKYVLIIEEMNRANAAGVFGDLFQLLDRDKGVSNYAITLPDAFAQYLYRAVSEELAGKTTQWPWLSAESFKNLRLPENLYIWGTMNSADQGVFPLDSAFKRRWSFIYKDLNGLAPEEANRAVICLPDCQTSNLVRTERYDWNVLRKAINRLILQAGFDEDRCIGYWFFTKEELADIEVHSNCVVQAFQGDPAAASQLEGLPNPFMDKLLAYLRQDVFRNIPTQFFREECRTLSAIRLAVNHLEVAGHQPVSLQGEVTGLPDSAFVAVPATPREKREEEPEQLEFAVDYSAGGAAGTVAKDGRASAFESASAESKNEAQSTSESVGSSL
ncbi:AAA domain-containing protein [Aminipila butyrica]|uniref:AAA domain-containing protein n=1 Tax=Aminipila butyrica TaxID=433296 RepID=A0A858BY57_9FIRM|nr:AAA family ATPase [Aminipila butyrica]QIB70055.1 AAA domain-containing protein [Aminipila butyrica]